MIHRIISIVILLAAFTSSALTMAQECPDNKMNRQEWFKQMRVYKHDFLTKELGLTAEQQQKFFPLYDAMNEINIKSQHECRQLERKINRSKASVSDLEYEKATEAVLETRAREVQTEKEYYAKFKGVLTPQQLYRLTQAERRFTREVMKQHSRMKQRKAD
ncbi:Spy/CpxP family protein refolding chaperone [uncultured Muribaculum sp.]|uniref:Spy/CpxP family protein refolding chaperone n=1 Tax=uncultured Muribaculum sp. TaxID=1918613 RepID=UPI0025E884F2|nr:Spy/CpxP family protein refolding chaperone [uncultured Muribaculum sp.]